MTDLLGRLGDLGGMGKDALIDLCAGIIDALGTGTDFTGAQIEKLGELEQRLADMIRTAKGGDDAGAA